MGVEASAHGGEAMFLAGIQEHLLELAGDGFCGSGHRLNSYIRSRGPNWTSARAGVGL
jgi:hypothetical protein